MKRQGLSAGIFSLGLALAVSACSSGGGGGGGGAMVVEFCSLGCNVNPEGVSCTVQNTFINQEISVTFSDPVDPASILLPEGAQTFQVIEEGTGNVPFGTRSIDPNNPRRVIFRPALSFLDGVPTFAFNPDATYVVTIPGEEQGDAPPYIRSMNGKPNQTRLRCFVNPDQGPTDPIPGNPTAVVSVSLDTGETVTVDDPGPTGVALTSLVTITFEDVMNPATLAVGGISPFIRILIDNDGNLTNPDDQVEMGGTYLVDTDLANLRTVMTFIPDNPLPSSGAGEMRRVVVEIPADVQDLVGNPVANPGLLSFTTIPVIFSDVTVAESFDTIENNDAETSGGEWEAGRTTRGLGGGSGRLGDLVLKSGEVLTLNTDSQVFPLVGRPRSLMDNTVPGIDYDPLSPASWPTITVTDGTFEFQRLIIESNAVLRFEGDLHARVLVRGDAVITGTLDLTGETPLPHASDAVYGGPPGQGGPGAGNGGTGGTRFDHSDFGILGVGGVGGPGDFDMGPMNLDGSAGEGVGGDVAGMTQGLGGTHFPPTYPSGVTTFGDHVGSGSVNADPCRSAQVGNSGSGGAYASDGTAGVAAADEYPFDFGGTIPNVSGVDTLPGDSTDFVDLDAIFLDPNLGDPPLGTLRGGSGGGGGGGHMYGTTLDPPVVACFSAFLLTLYWDHSGAAGGGGGGALSLSAGRRVDVTGTIDASGGDGGAGLNDAGLLAECGGDLDGNGTIDPFSDCSQNATPGGAGSGGAVRLQSKVVNVASSGLISVAGGLGGRGVTGSRGGDGGFGLIRIENSPDDPGDAVDPVAILDQIEPDLSGDIPLSETMLSVDGWPGQRDRPESYSGVMSCWYKPAVPEGTYFLLDFVEDDPVSQDPADKGWNMKVIYDDGSGEVELFYRGDDPSSPLPDSFENILGNLLNHDEPDGMGSYMSIRFQGARTEGTVASLCDVDLANIGGDISENSLTPWVQHPAELNQFNPRPNMIRFAITYDIAMVIADPGFHLFLKGFTDVEIKAQPD